jgi:septum formation protein
VADAFRLVLASASPRRLHLLRLAGLEPEVRPVDVDETVWDGEDPVHYVARLAREKAETAAVEGALVLGADTTVVLDGQSIGKPSGVAHAAEILRTLSGRTHTVSTGVAVVTAGGEVLEEVVTTRVTFAELSADVINAYVATGEPLDKAGAYGIQGKGAALVRAVNGSYTNVVGLPLVETLELLERAGAEPC